jgi:hypothetical protein
MKKRKRIGEIGEPWGMPVSTSKRVDIPSNTLIVVVRSERKLCAQWPESIPHTSACILTESEFIGSTWPTYLGLYPSFQLLLLRFQLR